MANLVEASSFCCRADESGGGGKVEEKEREREKWKKQSCRHPLVCIVMHADGRMVRDGGLWCCSTWKGASQRPKGDDCLSLAVDSSVLFFFCFGLAESCVHFLDLTWSD